MVISYNRFINTMTSINYNISIKMEHKRQISIYYRVCQKKGTRYIFGEKDRKLSCIRTVSFSQFMICKYLSNYKKLAYRSFLSLSNCKSNAKIEFSK